jgi:hypothetical protein
MGCSHILTLDSTGLSCYTISILGSSKFGLGDSGFINPRTVLAAR